MGDSGSVDPEEGTIDERVAGRQTRNATLAKLDQQQRGDILGGGVGLVRGLVK